VDSATLQEFLTFLIDSLSSVETEVVRCSFNALCDFCMSPLLIDPFIELGVFQSVTHVMKFGDGAFDYHSRIDSEILDKWGFCWDFLRYVVKYRAAACARWTEVLRNLAITNITCEHGDILSTSAEVAARIGQLDDGFLDSLSECGWSDDSEKVAAVFRAASILLKNPELPVEFLNEVLGIGLSVMNREHTCLQSEMKDEELMAEFDGEILPEIFRFLSKLARFRAPDFPARQVFEQIVGLENVVSMQETCLSLSCLIAFVSNAETDQTFLEHLFEFAQTLLSKSHAFSEPIILVRTIVHANPAVAAPQVAELVGFCENVLSEGPNLAVVSLLWTLVVHEIEFPIDQFLQFMVDPPVSGDRRELGNCAAAACQAALARPEWFGAAIGDLGRKMAELLRMPRLKLSDSLKQLMRQVIEVAASQGDG
jgi:hypothetical protein